MKNTLLLLSSLFTIFQVNAQLDFKLLLSENTGLQFQNTLIETPEVNVLTYQYYHNGGGVALGDINNDGLLDVYFVANLETNKLFLNKGELNFEDITATANISGGNGWATGVTMVDINNDGFLDIYVSKSGNLPADDRRNKLYVNNGDLTFTEKAKEYGLDDTAYSTQAYFLDYDKDGDLDMYLLNHPIFPVTPNADNIDFEFDRDPNSGDKLFRNDNNHFVEVGEKSGIKASPLSYGLSASIGDYNNDGYPDIYVCNDYMERDYLYMNNQDGTFTDELTTNTKHISNFSMGSDVADINNDGYLDIMIADMAAEDNYRSKTNMSGMNPERFWNYVDHGFHYQYMINTLQLNTGTGVFSEIAQLAGVDKTDWSWAPLFADFNSDGFKDLFVSNGLRKEGRNNDFTKKKKQVLKKMELYPDSTLYYMKLILDNMPQQPLPNYIYTNQGDLTFENANNTGMEVPSFSNGTAYGDLDLDGDLDLVVNNIDHEAFLYENKSASGNYISINLTGSANNKQGIGAKVSVQYGGEGQTIEHYVSRGYLSSVSNTLHFGLGNQTKIDRIDVAWSDGNVSLLENVKCNQQLTINYSPSSDEAPESINNEKTLATSIEVLDFVHQENDFDDFEREVLLPHQMSTLGPALAVADVNGDGTEDFYVGGALGQSGALYIQSQEGKFSKSQGQLWDQNKQSEETVATFFDFDQDGDLDLYVGCGGNENENGATALRDVLYENNKGVFLRTNLLPEELSISTGCIAPHDFDNDGDLDLFIGNRQTPGLYPKASPSYLLENIEGKFSINTSLANSVLDNLGMVTQATWADVAGSDQKELIVTGEWMPIKVFSIEADKLIDKSEVLGFTQSNAWWFGMATGDIDNDGDIDIIGGNLGLNYKYKASYEGPFQVYTEDLNKDGKNDIVLGYNQDGETYPLRGRQCSSQQMPEILEKFPNYNLFALSTLEEVYDDQLDKALKLEAYDFSSAVFINNGGEFTRVNFSKDLQLFNWDEIVLTDLNNDGDLDIVTAGNLYEAEVETPRCDAGNGLILLGEGNGQFEKINASQVNWGNHNIKNLKIIEVGGKKAVLLGNNNESLEIMYFE